MGIIIDNIKKNSNKYSNDIAVYYRDKDTYESITNNELCDFTDSLSEYFYDKYKNKSIAIIGNNKLEYLVSFLAFIGNIGDVLLIDKELNKDDILDILKKVKIDLIICDDELNLNFETFKQVKFSEINKIMKQKKTFNKNVKHSGNLILHTSGTTGKPKCVKITEENLYGGIKETNKKWELAHGQSCLLIIPLYHIYALVSFLNCSYSGLAVVLEYDYNKLNDVLKYTKPSLFMGVPLMYNRIKDNILNKNEFLIKSMIFISNILLKLKIDIRKKLFKKIYDYFGGNYIWGCSAGSLLPYETHKFFNDIGLPIYNVYGMSETSGSVAINYKNNNIYNSVGKILDINKVQIIDKDEEGIGEIAVKGPNICEGYIGENNSSSFKEGYFRTGDLGYIKEGYLYILGRKKNILIGANGKNVSPAELNSKILKNKKINDCNVILENDKLIAIINTELDREKVKDFINKVNDKLPNYKKISDFRITDKKIK